MVIYVSPWMRESTKEPCDLSHRAFLHTPILAPLMNSLKNFPELVEV